MTPTTPPPPPPTSILLLAATIPFIALLLLLLLLLTLPRRTIPTKSPPPGPPGLPLLGHLSLLLRPNLHRHLALLSLTYGPIMHLRLGAKLWIVISSPEIAKQIFTENDADFSDHEQPVAATVISYGGANLVRCPYGPTWRMLRRVFVRELIINAKSLAAAVELRRVEMQRAVRGIWAKQGKGVNVGELAFEVSLNMLMGMLCGGRRSAKWRDEGGEFRKVMMEAVELLGRRNVSDYFPMISWFDLQGIERKMKRRVTWMDRVYEDMIEERMRMRGCGDREGGGGEDLLSRLLRIRDGEEPGFKISHIQLKGLMMVIMVFFF